MYFEWFIDSIISNVIMAYSKKIEVEFSISIDIHNKNYQTQLALNTSPFSKLITPLIIVSELTKAVLFYQDILFYYPLLGYAKYI